MRCFIGIPLKKEHKSKLKDIIAKSKKMLSSKISWTKIETWHLTLCFLGEMSAEKVEILKKRLKDIKYSSFYLKPGIGGFFPSIKRPRVLWLGLEKGAKETKELAQYICELIEELNIDFDKKGFVPHLTIGRVKSIKEDNWNKWLKYTSSLNWEGIKVSSFILWQSILTPEGPIHKVIEEYPLIDNPLC